MKNDRVKVFKALSDPNRVRILKMVLVRELCLCEVRDVLGLSNSTVSKHLSILRDAGLILDSKDGKWVNFRVHDQADDEVVRSAIALVRKSFDDDAVIREDLKRVKRVDRAKICGV
ncbi:MAG: metalloregulator ArsR/SmtB family transcription factor [Bacteroidetes bacterium]|jgi:ArsR family transcriptional regulator|nr:metalloregulator ArsR/SmtB family transcription factor [Bacteroidota bacterium]